MVQFESVDQFRWPGWFSAALGIAYIIVFLLFFVERMPSCCKLSLQLSRSKECRNKSMKKAKKWRLPGLKQFLVSLCAMFAFEAVCKTLFVLYCIVCIVLFCTYCFP